MDKDLIKRVEDLEREIQNMKRGLNIDVANGLERNLATTFLNVRTRSDVTNSDVKVTKTITIGADGESDTVDILDFPDRWVYVYLDGKLHRMAAWLEEFDGSRSYGS